MPRWRSMLLPILAAGGLLVGCTSAACSHGPSADARTARSPDSASVSPSNAGTHRGSIATAFDLPARVPHAWDYFPACVPLGASPFLPAADIIPDQR